MTRAAAARSTLVLLACCALSAAPALADDPRFTGEGSVSATIL